VIQGTIRTVAVICTQILDCSKDDRIIVVDTASTKKVMGAVPAFCEFTLPISQPCYSHQSLTTLGDSLTPYSKHNDIIKQQDMSKSAKPNVVEQWVRESH
jgi:hypothetical protein